MSRTQMERFFVGRELESVGRAVEQMQNFSTDQDVRRLSADTTLEPEDDLVLVDTTSGSITIKLPFIDDAQRKVYVIKKLVAGNTLTVDGSGTETIDGGTVAVTAQYAVIRALPERDTTIAAPTRTWWSV